MHYCAILCFYLTMLSYSVPILLDSSQYFSTPSQIVAGLFNAFSNHCMTIPRLGYTIPTLLISRLYVALPFLCLSLLCLFTTNHYCTFPFCAYTILFSSHALHYSSYPQRFLSRQFYAIPLLRLTLPLTTLPFLFVADFCESITITSVTERASGNHMASCSLN